MLHSCSWGKSGWLLDAAASLPQFLCSKCDRRYDGAQSSPHHPERHHPRASVWVRHRHPSCIVVGRPNYHFPILDNNKVHSSYVHARSTRGGLQCSLFYLLFDRSGVDTLISRPTCHQHDLRQTHRDGSSTYPLPFFFDVNITNTCNPSKSQFSVKSACRLYGSAHCTDAPNTTAKRDFDGTPPNPPFSSVGTTYTDHPGIQNSAPPLSKMGRDTANYPPLPCTSCNIQVRSVLLRRARLDKNNARKQTHKRRNQRQYAGVTPLVSLVNVPKRHPIRFWRDHHAFLFTNSP